MSITTGRVAGDYGQLSYVGYHKDKSSRPDHILLSPAVYKLMKGFDMIDALASDHCGLSMEEALAFSDHLVNNVELLNQFQEAEFA
eukprot:651579-Pelagomonas_calceolata.AAC.1